MKKFRFTLHAVLTLRQRAEQTALENYARVIRVRDAALGKLSEVDSGLAAAWSQARLELAAGCRAVEATQLQGYCSVLAERKKNCEESCRQAERDLHTASRSVLHARQEREAVENLKSRQRDRYERESSIVERKEIEDLRKRRAPAATSWTPAPNPN